jgi:hypothetical protein
LLSCDEIITSAADQHRVHDTAGQEREQAGGNVPFGAASCAVPSAKAIGCSEASRKEMTRE